MAMHWLVSPVFCITITKKAGLKPMSSVLYAIISCLLYLNKHHTNTQTVYDWLKHTLIPKLKQKCIIVMDNAPFHKSNNIKKLLNRHGHRVLFLPPYSPHLNPIEHKWGQSKSLRQGWLIDDLDELFGNMGVCGDFMVC